MKVSEASGAALDWMVVQCERDVGREPGGGSYSTDPALAWPIIEREEIGFFKEGNYWVAGYALPGGYLLEKRGSTSLIAAMRCYVASKLGEEVDVPKELIK